MVIEGAFFFLAYIFFCLHPVVGLGGLIVDFDFWSCFGF